MICEGKRGYYSFSEANTAMKVIRRSSARGEIPNRVYRCNCGLWHLTHTNAFKPTTKKTKMKEIAADDINDWI